MATQETQQSAAQGTSQDSGSLKTKYLGVLKDSVVDPLRQDLERRAESLRGELRELDSGGSGDRAQVQRRIELLGRVQNAVEAEFSRLQNLRLNDFT
jgi:hypothetical protein